MEQDNLQQWHAIVINHANKPSTGSSSNHGSFDYITVLQSPETHYSDVAYDIMSIYASFLGLKMPNRCSMSTYTVTNKETPVFLNYHRFLVTNAQGGYTTAGTISVFLSKDVNELMYATEDDLAPDSLRANITKFGAFGRDVTRYIRA